MTLEFWLQYIVKLLTGDKFDSYYELVPKLNQFMIEFVERTQNIKKFKYIMNI